MSTTPLINAQMPTYDLLSPDYYILQAIHTNLNKLHTYSDRYCTLQGAPRPN
jgi:hypothetical protein